MVCCRNGKYLHYWSLFLRVKSSWEILSWILWLRGRTGRHVWSIVGFTPDIPCMYCNCGSFPLCWILSIVHRYHCSCMPTLISWSICDIYRTVSFQSSYLFVNKHLRLHFDFLSKFPDGCCFLHWFISFHHTYIKHSYSKWNWPRFTNTASSFSRLTTGNRPPKLFIFLSMNSFSQPYSKAMPKSFPFLE